MPGAGIADAENPGAIQVSSVYACGTLISQFPGPAGLKCVYRFDFGDVLLDGPGIGMCWSKVLSSQAWHGQLLNDNYQKAMMQDLEMKSDNLKKDDFIPARFTISGAAKAHIEAAKEDFNKNSLDPLDVVGIGWGEIRPKGGRVFEDVVVGFYRLSQKREIFHLIQHVSGVDLVFYVAPANQEKFEDKTLDYTETRGFHLR